MKKVIRLNENDVEKLVRKIISEEKKSINEGPLNWIRKKFNQDEEVGLLIVKALESGEIEEVEYDGQTPMNLYRYSCVLNGHRVECMRHISFRGSDTFGIKIDDEQLDISTKISKKIFKLMSEIHEIPNLKKRNEKLGNIKTSLSRYNLPSEERKNLENPETFFEKLD